VEDNVVDGLLRCEKCRHGAISHEGLGCDVRACKCTATREEVIAHGIEVAKEEIRMMWERPSA
jgi:hypothetical protein